MHTAQFSGLRRVLLALALVFGALGCVDDSALEAHAWSGSVTQGGLHYRVCMQVSNTSDVGEFAGDIDYPDLACGGTLSYAGSAGDTQIFQEHISYGNCVDHGRIEVTMLSSGAFRWLWFYRDSQRVAASSTLMPSDSCGL